MAQKAKSPLKRNLQYHQRKGKLSIFELHCFCLKSFVILAALIVVGVLFHIQKTKQAELHIVEAKLAAAKEQNGGLSRAKEKIEQDLTSITADLAAAQQQQDQLVATNQAMIDALTAANDAKDVEISKLRALDRHDGPRQTAVARKHIVYTAAGDHSSVMGWIDCHTAFSTPREFSLFVSYYGTDMEASTLMKSMVEASSGIFEYAQGWKLDLLYDAFHKPSYAYFFQDAEYIGIFDDDLNFDVGKLNLLFRIHKSSNLMLSAPSLSAPGAFWRSNTHVDGCLFRRSAFVEISAPVMSVSALKLFFSIWKPHMMIGNSVDFAILSILKLYWGMTENDYGVIDAVQVTNPKKRSDSGLREIDTHASEAARMKAGQDYKKKYPNQFDFPWIESMTPSWHNIVGFGHCEAVSDEWHSAVEQSFQCGN
jgi:hypothetical protein